MAFTKVTGNQSSAGVLKQINDNFIQTVNDFSNIENKTNDLQSQITEVKQIGYSVGDIKHSILKEPPNSKWIKNDGKYIPPDKYPKLGEATEGNFENLCLYNMSFYHEDKVPDLSGKNEGYIGYRVDDSQLLSKYKLSSNSEYLGDSPSPFKFLKVLNKIYVFFVHYFSEPQSYHTLSVFFGEISLNSSTVILKPVLFQTPKQDAYRYLAIYDFIYDSNKNQFIFLVGASRDSSSSNTYMDKSLVFTMKFSDNIINIKSDNSTQLGNSQKKILVPMFKFKNYYIVFHEFYQSYYGRKRAHMTYIDDSTFKVDNVYPYYNNNPLDFDESHNFYIISDFNSIGGRIGSEHYFFDLEQMIIAKNNQVIKAGFNNSRSVEVSAYTNKYLAIIDWNQRRVYINKNRFLNKQELFNFSFNDEQKYVTIGISPMGDRGNTYFKSINDNVWLYSRPLGSSNILGNHEITVIKYDEFKKVINSYVLYANLISDLEEDCLLLKNETLISLLKEKRKFIISGYYIPVEENIFNTFIKAEE